MLGRLLGANISLYVGMSRLAVSYLQDVVGSLQALGGSPDAGSESAHPPSKSTTRAGPLVLEAESGQVAVGAFMVQNGLDARVSTVIEASGFADEQGHSVTPEIVFQPPDVTLEPGEKTLVKVVVRLGDEIRAGTDYVGAVTIPGLSNRRLELLLRSRRPADAGSAPIENRPGRRARRAASHRPRPKPSAPMPRARP